MVKFDFVITREKPRFLVFTISFIVNSIFSSLTYVLSRDGSTGLIGYRENSKIQEWVYGMQEVEGIEIVINESYIRNNVLNGQQNNSTDIEKQFTDYIASFTVMAKKGFVSLDRKEGNEFFGWHGRKNQGI